MAAPFLARQVRANAAVMRHLANAEAIVAGVSIPVVFERLATAINGVEVTQPTALMQSSDVAGNQVKAGTTLTIPAAIDQAPWGSQEGWAHSFTVLDLQPDGTGMTLLILEAA